MIPEAAARLIGKTDNMIIMEVEKGAIKKYADAVSDYNPLYWNAEYARNSRYGSLIAPPGFFGWPCYWAEAGPIFSGLREEIIKAITEAGFDRVLDGGIEYEFYLPVRAGDTLAAAPRIKDIYERESKNGKMLFSVIETSYMNQNGDMAARARQTLIYR